MISREEYKRKVGSRREIKEKLLELMIEEAERVGGEVEVKREGGKSDRFKEIKERCEVRQKGRVVRIIAMDRWEEKGCVTIDGWIELAGYPSLVMVLRELEVD
jgi:hypothetical protein